MAADIPTVEPLEHEAGTTLKFTRTLPDFPADTWTLTYELRSHENAPITITATADGTDHAINEGFSTTVDWNAGDYVMTGYVTDGTERHRVYQGKLTLKPYTADEGTYEWRSFARRMLKKVEDAIDGRIDRTQVSYSINGRSFTAITHEDLFRARDYWLARVKHEDKKGRNRKILVRFRNAR